MKQTRESLDLIINKRCNNNCIFCADHFHKEKIPVFSGRMLHALLSKGRKITDAVLFTSFEPTVNKSLIDYVRFSKKIGYKKIRLVTNGRLFFYPGNLDDLLKAGLNEISISLHGANVKIHDALTRTPGSFMQTVKGCRNLQRIKARYPVQWYINVTLTKINAPYLYNLFKMAISFKHVDGVIVNALMPHGRGLRFFDSLIVSYTDLAAEFKSAIDRLMFEYNNRIPGRLSIAISGLPFCLLRGYEKYVGNREQLITSSDSHALNIKIKSRIQMLKGKLCKGCKDFLTCDGVWAEYIKKRGWLEFQPLN